MISIISGAEILYQRCLILLHFPIGCWDSIHVVEVQEKSSGRSAHYKLTSTSMLWLQVSLSLRRTKWHAHNIIMYRKYVAVKHVSAFKYIDKSRGFWHNEFRWVLDTSSWAGCPCQWGLTAHCKYWPYGWGHGKQD